MGKGGLGIGCNGLVAEYEGIKCPLQGYTY